MPKKCGGEELAVPKRLLRDSATLDFLESGVSCNFD